MAMQRHMVGSLGTIVWLAAQRRGGELAIQPVMWVERIRQIRSLLWRAITTRAFWTIAHAGPYHRTNLPWAVVAGLERSQSSSQSSPGNQSRPFVGI